MVLGGPMKTLGDGTWWSGPLKTLGDGTWWADEDTR